mgnify:CR=1 FL=1
MATDTTTVELVGDEVATNVARAALFAALVGAFAYVTFPNPFSPTNLSLQVLGVFLAGVFLGPAWGTVSMVVYLVAGALGAPVFVGGTAGLGHLLGQNVGYLLSYPVAAGVVGIGVHGFRELGDPRVVPVRRLVGAMVAGTAVIYALGVAGLMLRLGLGPVEAFLAGAAAFIPAEVLKIAAAVGVVRSDALAVE